MTKRTFDIFSALLSLLIFALPCALIAAAVRLSSPGPAIYWSDRVGRGEKLFEMPKFRTMRIGTPTVATHLLSNSDDYVTPFGRFLRKSSMDELPQLWSVLIGDMSLVGPRPALFNQEDLINLRAAFGLNDIRPGVTGWAQIHGRDELTISEKVDLDVEYASRQSLLFDLRIILLTVTQVARRKGVSH